MLIAMNGKKKELILADAELDKNENYLCPSCESRVHLKIGAVIRPHFAHYQKAECTVFSEGETEEHIDGKLHLAQWFEKLNLKIEVEAYLPELKQRPDLLLTINHQQVAVEFQCSSIPIEKVVERTNGYQNAGYKVVWILGEQFNYRRKLTGFQKACLTNVDHQLVLFHYSTQKQRLEYWYDFQLKQTRKLRASKRILRWGEKLILRLESRVGTTPKINYEIEHQKLLRQCQRPSPKTQQFLQRLYENKESILSMPRELYTVAPNEWLIQTHPHQWKYEFILWLEAFPIHTIITKRMLKTYIQQIKFYDIPQVSSEQQLQPFYEVIEGLVDSRTLQQIRLNKWAIKGYPQRFQNLEEKYHP